MAVPKVKLPTGYEVPQVGLGLWHVKNEAQFMAGFEAATQAGYRHFDTAQAYANEQMLGRAWKNSGIKRQEYFLTTKIKISNFGPKHLLKSFEKSLEKLDTDYIDLLLLHFPVPLIKKKAWRTLEKIQASGRAKNIGVSNYSIQNLEEMKNYATIMPAVNQVELHVFLQQPELIKYCHDHRIAIEAYSPLAHAKATDDRVIAGIAKKHGKSYAQIMLRWLIEKDIIVLPKSITPSRIQENIAIFNFKLDSEDLAALMTRNKGMHTIISLPLVIAVTFEIMMTIAFRNR